MWNCVSYVLMQLHRLGYVLTAYLHTRTHTRTQTHTHAHIVQTPWLMLVVMSGTGNCDTFIVVWTQRLVVNRKFHCSFCLQKWSKGKVRDKLNNLILFDKATYDKLYKEVPTYKLITPAVVSERLKVRLCLCVCVCVCVGQFV